MLVLMLDLESDDWAMIEPEHIRLLRSIRQVTGWSQRQLGYELGVSRHTIMRWEAGQIQPYPGRHLLIERLAQRVASATRHNNPDAA